MHFKILFDGVWQQKKIDKSCNFKKKKYQKLKNKIQRKIYNSI